MAQQDNNKYLSYKNVDKNSNIAKYRENIFSALKALKPLLDACKAKYDEKEQRLAVQKASSRKEEPPRAALKPVSEPVEVQEEVKEERKPEPKAAPQKSSTPGYVKGRAAIIYTDVKPAKKPDKKVPQDRGAAKKPESKKTPADFGGAARTPRPLKTGASIPSMVYTPPPSNQPSTKRSKDKKNDKSQNYEDKAPMTKRTLIRKGFLTEDGDDDRVRVRKLKGSKKKQEKVIEHRVIDHIVVTSDRLSIKELSEKMGVGALDIMQMMIQMGGTPVTSINDTVDRDTMILVADAFNVNLEYNVAQTKEEIAEEMHYVADSEEDLVERPPVITVMGHVDHGKTSLLDAIRKTNVASGEAGGITQHIGAYSVSWDYDGRRRKITFLDTPGHEAFTSMRARGAKITDIVVLVVAADDGVKPQTIEAIDHVKAAGCPMIVAINKIDKAGASIEKIKEELSAHGVLSDDWGGDVKMVPISAKNRMGIDTLLEEILFLADFINLRANPNRKAKGAIIEARKDTGKGPVATILVQNGTLSKGDAVVCGTIFGKIRTMTDYSGKPVRSAGPSSAVLVTGLSDVPSAGDDIWVVDDEKTAREIATSRLDKDKVRHSEELAIKSFDVGTQKDFNIIIKADVVGSAEALKGSIDGLHNEEIKAVVIHAGVGTITKSDMMLAEVSNAMVIGFNVKPDAEARQIAEQSKIKVESYSVIYDAIDAVEAMMNGLTEPKFRTVYTGRAQVRAIFKSSNKGNIAGCYILDGKISRNSKIKVIRAGQTVFEGTIANLKRFKDDVKEVSFGFECGITINGYDDFEENDEIEAYVEERI
ncbi:MAG: translation initiation factor IF-2 [Clostridia bacterium]|nr:translation initiation factor IF-2 [Clostridia bacterium]